MKGDQYSGASKFISNYANIAGAAMTGMGVMLSQYQTMHMREVQTVSKGIVAELTRISDIIKTINASFVDSSLAESVVKNMTVTASALMVSQFGLKGIQDTLSLLSKTLKLETAGILSDITKSHIEVLQNFGADFSKVSASGGVLTYEGKTYSEDEIRAEIQTETESYVREKPTLKEKIEVIKNKYWLLFAIIYFFIFVVPGLDAAKEYYGDKYESIIKPIVYELTNKKLYLTVIKEKGYVRKDSNSRSEIIAELVYADSVEILEKIPYWYKVKFEFDEKEYVGWVSVKTLGTEENINE